VDNLLIDSTAHIKTANRNEHEEQEEEEDSPYQNAPGEL